MSNLFYENREDQKNYLNSVRKTHEAGFKVMDFNMCPFQRHETELLGDDWEERVYEIANEAAKLGIEFSQSHPPYPKPAARRKSPLDEGCELNEFIIRATERSIRISAMLGVKWAVMHPVQDFENGELDLENDLAYNHRIYDRYFELASSLGVGIAFENMADIDGKRRFGSTPDELNALVDSYNSRYVGACWDFGHGNRMFADQSKALARLGSRLKATHLDDNVGKDDLHTLPFFGNINWPDTVKTLRSINYDGDLTYEINVFKRMPAELLMPSVKYAREIGEYLLKL
jgi:sugar phosphate isomerase/epimerase